MARLANRLYTYADLRYGVDNGLFLPVYNFTETSNVAVNKAQTLARVKVVAGNLPDDRMPTWDDLVPVPVTNVINWTNAAASGLDSGLKFYVNGVLITTQTGASGTFTAVNDGDTVEVVQYAPSSWTGSGTATLSRTVNGDFKNVATSTYANNLNSLTFIYHTGSVSVSAKTEVAGTLAPALLVIDFNQMAGTSFDMVAYIDNVEAAENYQYLVYSGNNFCPYLVGASPDENGDVLPPLQFPNAMIIASDPVLPYDGGLDFRYIFNVAKILNTYPGISVLNMVVRGRSTTADIGQCLWSLKGGATTPTITGNSFDQNLVPGVTYDNFPGGFADFGVFVGTGADGTKSTSLPQLVRFQYTVATNSMTITHS